MKQFSSISCFNKKTVGPMKMKCEKQQTCRESVTSRVHTLSLVIWVFFIWPSVSDLFFLYFVCNARWILLCLQNGNDYYYKIIAGD